MRAGASWLLSCTHTHNGYNNRRKAAGQSGAWAMGMLLLATLNTYLYTLCAWWWCTGRAPLPGRKVRWGGRTEGFRGDDSTTLLTTHTFRATDRGKGPLLPPPSLSRSLTGTSRRWTAWPPWQHRGAGCSHGKATPGSGQRPPKVRTHHRIRRLMAWMRGATPPPVDPPDKQNVSLLEQERHRYNSTEQGMSR